jgi:hypothetical protein
VRSDAPLCPDIQALASPLRKRRDDGFNPLVTRRIPCVLLREFEKYCSKKLWIEIYVMLG